MPTVVESTIGGSSPDYATIAAWVAATSYNLVAADEVHIGLLRSGTYAEDAILFGATTDSTRFRVLQADVGHEYDPVAGSGAKVTGAGNTRALVLGEAYAQAKNIGVQYSGNGSNNAAVLTVAGCVADSVSIIDNCSAAATTRYALFAVAGTTIVNCLVYRIAVGSNGFINGIQSAGTVINCSVYNIAGIGIRPLSGATIYNCIAIGSTTADYQTGVSGTYDYNVSGDGTAIGTNVLTSVTSSSVWMDVSAHDFRLVPGGPAIDFAHDASAPAYDIVGTTRAGEDDAGAYDEASSSTEHALDGTSSGEGSATGSLAASVAVSGACSGIGSAEGTLSASVALSGISAGEASASGAIALGAALSGIASGSSSASGTAFLSAALSGASEGVSGAIGSLAGLADLAGVAAGDSTVAGSVVLSHRLAGTASGSGSATAWIALHTRLSGVSDGTSEAVGELAPPPEAGAGSAPSTLLFGVDRDLRAPHVALRHLDGFEVAQNRVTLRRRYGIVNGDENQILPGTGRKGGLSLQWPTAGSALQLHIPTRVDDDPTAPVTVGLALRWDSLAGLAWPLIDLRSPTLSQLALWVTGDGAGNAYLGVLRGGTILGQTEMLPGGRWYYLELRALIRNAAGEYELRIDQVPAVSGAGDTQSDAAPDVSEVRLELRTAPGAAILLDDVYVASWRAGWREAGFLGDITTVGLFPAGDADVDLAPTGAGANWEAVRDPGLPDDDLTFVATDGAAGVDVYRPDALPAGRITGGIAGFGVSLELRRRTTVNPNLVARARLRHDAYDVDADRPPTAITPDLAYREVHAAWPTDPCDMLAEIQDVPRILNGFVAEVV
ncbi:MAG: right-handed parallel beta-helix repeat-containing protein [Dehalococcoidia bacterium]